MWMMVVGLMGGGLMMVDERSWFKEVVGLMVMKIWWDGWWLC